MIQTFRLSQWQTAFVVGTAQVARLDSETAAVVVRTSEGDSQVIAGPIPPADAAWLAEEINESSRRLQIRRLEPSRN